MMRPGDILDRRSVAVTVRPYRPGDEEGIVALINKVFSDNKDLSWWRWKYEDNPLGTPIIEVAEHEGSLIGHRAFLPWQLSFDRSLLAYQLTDAAVHIDFQRHGVMKRLTQAATKASSHRPEILGLGFPNPAHMRLYDRLGWREIGCCYWGAWLPRFHSLGRLFQSAPGGIRDIEVEPLVRRQISIEDNRRGVEGYPFLEWRYLRHPSHRYYILFGAGRETAILFRIVEWCRSQAGLLLDLFGDPSGLRSLQTQMRDLSDTLDLACWLAWIPGRKDAAWRWMKNGFIPIPWKRQSVRTRSLGAGLSPEGRLPANFSLGDADWL